MRDIQIYAAPLSFLSYTMAKGPREASTATGNSGAPPRMAVWYA
jgi:hypothetical protein